LSELLLELPLPVPFSFAVVIGDVTIWCVSFFVGSLLLLLPFSLFLSLAFLSELLSSSFFPPPIVVEKS